MSVSSRAIIKVGKTSKLRFRDLSVYRAITVHEMQSLIKKYTDINIVVIENIVQSEYEGIKQFISKFVGADPKNRVFFYVEDNDSTTCGVADELSYDIYLNIKDLYRSIKLNCNISVDVDISSNRKVGEPSDIFDDSFQDALDTISKSDPFIEKLPEIENKDDIDEFDTSIIRESGNEQDESTNNNHKDLEDSLNRAQNEIATLKARINDLVSDLESKLFLIKAVEAERDNFKDRLKKFDDSEVMEQPITLEKYRGLKDKIAELEGKISRDNSDELNKKIKDAEVLAEELKSNLNDAVRHEDELEDQVSKLNEIIESLNRQLEESKNTSIELQSTSSELAIKNNTISQLEDELKQKSSQVESLDATVAALEEDVKEHKSSIDTLTKAVDSEKDTRAFILSLLQKSIRIARELKNEITALRNENEDKDKKLADQSKTIDDMSNKNKLSEEAIGRLEQQVKDVDKRVELARSYAGQELENTRKEASDWQSRFEDAKKRLETVETQYNSLVKSVGLDGSGLNTLLESNKAIETVNSTLRDQIISLKNELEKSRKEYTLAKQSISSLEESNKSMRVSMKALTLGISGGTTGLQAIPSLNYNGKAMIIPVFGCGSFGITTTAMSIATKLAAHAKVLYIDFDMVSPKADGWFRINPMIRDIPDVDVGSGRATALSIFIDKQIQYFLNYSSSLILRPVQTKNGSIDYIGGIYTKPDIVKLVSADFSSFINFCGNNYTYIIIDFGRLGSSDVNDQLIKLFSDIAYRSVVVTTFDKFEIRTFRMKLFEAQIDVTNIAWLVNMCERTTLDDTAKKSISPARYSLMPFNCDMYGKRIDFTKDKLTRDKLSLFMDTILFKK